MHSWLSMNLFATFAFLLPGHPTLSTTFDYLKQRKKTAEKIDTNAQWFHCSWSILLKRVNIRVRGFHLFRGNGTLKITLHFSMKFHPPPPQKKWQFSDRCQNHAPGNLTKKSKRRYFFQATWMRFSAATKKKSWKFHPSKLEWDRIPTDPVQEVAF